MHVSFSTFLRTHSFFSKMTMEVILSTAFGRSIDVQGGAGGKIVEAAYELFSAFSPGPDDKPRPFILFLHLISRQYILMQQAPCYIVTIITAIQYLVIGPLWICIHCRAYLHVLGLNCMPIHPHLTCMCADYAGFSCYNQLVHDLTALLH